MLPGGAEAPNLNPLQVTRLRYTPRRLVLHPTARTIILAEGDHGAVALAQRADLLQRAQEAGVQLQ
eukprot:226866-Chlamydomonas_euryale.AAC.1